MVTLKVRDYEVGVKIGESSKFRIYLGEDPQHQVILKVAKTFNDGDVLSEEATHLRLIWTIIGQIADYQTEQLQENAHYDWLFAKLENSFMEPSQQDRRINVLSAVDTKLSQLTPLPKLRHDTEIDVRTSVWLLGRFLKLYGFYEILSYADDNPITDYLKFSPADFLIGPEHHRLILYNYSGKIRDTTANSLVKLITKFIYDWIGFDIDERSQRYRELLENYISIGRTSFEEAHGEFYDLVQELWGIKYHPFTYRKRDTQKWQIIKEE